jgi:hypothetical protein
MTSIDHGDPLRILPIHYPAVLLPGLANAPAEVWEEALRSVRCRTRHWKNQTVMNSIVLI